MHLGRQFQWFLSMLLLCGMIGVSFAKSCEELGKKGPNWLTMDGTWGFVEGIEHIPGFPALNNNVIRLRPYSSMYGLEGWHVSMLSVTLESGSPPPGPGVLISEGFATFVGVLGKVTQNDDPVINPADIIAEGVFLAPFQRDSAEFDGSDNPPVIDGEIHYKGTLGFEGMHGKLTYTLDFPEADGGLWEGCFHVPFQKTFKKLVE